MSKTRGSVGEDVYLEPTDADLVFWQQCQSRVSAYLTTNGLIEITLCGLYATTASVLVAFGATQVEHHQYVVFNLILPVFSVIALALAANVYAWIALQLEYLAVISLHPSQLVEMPTYEKWRAMVRSYWAGLPKSTRLLATISTGAKLVILLPCQIGNIYKTYFLIYTATGIASSVYATSHGGQVYNLVIVALALVAVLTIAMHPVTRLQTACEAVRLEIIASSGARIGPKYAHIGGQK